MPEAARVVGDLRRDALAELLIPTGKRHAGEQYVLPHADAQLVARFVEGLVLVPAATPHTQHVHVGGRGVLAPGAQVLMTGPTNHGIGRDPVGTLREEAHTVALEGERLPRLIRLPDETQSAQPN